ncbi:hypothetical protein STRAU_7205 [Streptomyces aurantiacus JA 4570]|uniref:Uncharacterized protein n=1 Tax=Streptomyces aurantiacus JA 4570 TaxID=1286094 RepID=S3Z7N9_9ACTN|nr:hypothetical protein STRAU_7205 [Streptomyces aurantiacus JA 4570]
MGPRPRGGHRPLTFAAPTGETTMDEEQANSSRTPLLPFT